LAARRAEAQDIQNLRELSELLITAFKAREAKVVASGFQRWLDGLIDAGHSIAVRWIANPFLDALRHTLQRFPMLWILEPSFPEHLTEVLAAIEQCDEDRAALLTRTYYERVDSQLLQLLRSGIIEQGHVFALAQSTKQTETPPSRITSVDAGDRRGRHENGSS
jgi:DNA-binding GntR family transcriptional regulator